MVRFHLIMPMGYVYEHKAAVQTRPLHFQVRIINHLHQCKSCISFHGSEAENSIDQKNIEPMYYSLVGFLLPLSEGWIRKLMLLMETMLKSKCVVILHILGLVYLTGLLMAVL